MSKRVLVVSYSQSGQLARLKESFLRDVRGVGVVRLEALDVIRHDVVARIVEAYDRADKARRDSEKKPAELQEKKPAAQEKAAASERGEADA